MIILVLAFPLVITSGKCAKAQTGNSSEDIKSPGESAELFFGIKVPDSFKSVAVDEPGILKWVNGPAEIYLVVGEIFSKSGPVIFDALKKAAKRDKSVEEIKNIKIKGAKAVLFKERAPADLNRLRSWRLLVVTEKQIVNVDFTAPAKEFKTYIQSFDDVARSFKLKSKS